MQPPLFYTVKSLYYWIEERMCTWRGKERRKVTKYNTGWCGMRLLCYRMALWLLQNQNQPMSETEERYLESVYIVRSFFRFLWKLPCLIATVPQELSTGMSAAAFSLLETLLELGACRSRLALSTSSKEAESPGCFHGCLIKSGAQNRTWMNNCLTWIFTQSLRPTHPCKYLLHIKKKKLKLWKQKNRVFEFL